MCEKDSKFPLVDASNTKLLNGAIHTMTEEFADQLSFSDQKNPPVKPVQKKNFTKQWVNSNSHSEDGTELVAKYAADGSCDDDVFSKRLNRQSESSDSGYHQKKAGDDEVSTTSLNGTAEVLSDHCCDVESLKCGSPSPSSSPSSVTVAINPDASVNQSVAKKSVISELPIDGSGDGPSISTVDTDWETMCDSEIYVLRNAEGNEIRMHTIPDELWPEDWDIGAAGSDPSRKSGGDTYYWNDMEPPDDSQAFIVKHIPKHYAGIIFGKKGKNLRDLRDRLGGKITLTEHEDDPNFQTLHMVCPKENQEEVEKWLYKKMTIGYRNDSSYHSTNISNPHQLVQFLPEGEFVPVIVLGMPSKTELFVQMYVPGEYERFIEFQQRLNHHYSTEDCPHLPVPVSVGVVCVAPYNDGRYYRAKIVHRAVTSDHQELALVMYLDYGGFMWHPISALHKIRSEFMNFLFQATLIKWAHAQPTSPAPQDHIFRSYMEGRLLYAYGVTTMPCCITHTVLYSPSRLMTPDNIRHPDPAGLVDILGQAVFEGNYEAVAYTLPERTDLDGVGGYFCPEVGAFNYEELCTLVDLESIREHRHLNNSPDDDLADDEGKENTRQHESPSRVPRPPRFSNNRSRWNRSSGPAWSSNQQRSGYNNSSRGQRYPSTRTPPTQESNQKADVSEKSPSISETIVPEQPHHATKVSESTAKSIADKAPSSSSVPT